MRVMIDETRSNDAPVGIDDALGGGAFISADPDDFPLGYCHVRLECRLARAVHDATILDEQIIPHDSFSSLPRPCEPGHHRGGPLPPGQWSIGISMPWLNPQPT